MKCKYNVIVGLYPKSLIINQYIFVVFPLVQMMIYFLFSESNLNFILKMTFFFSIILYNTREIKIK